MKVALLNFNLTTTAEVVDEVGAVTMKYDAEWRSYPLGWS
jgi:hypothetical protein